MGTNAQPQWYCYKCILCTEGELSFLFDQDIREGWKDYINEAAYNLHFWDTDQETPGHNRVTDAQIEIALDFTDMPKECEAEALSKNLSPINYYPIWKQKQKDGGRQPMEAEQDSRASAVASSEAPAPVTQQQQQPQQQQRQASPASSPGQLLTPLPYTQQQVKELVHRLDERGAPRIDDWGTLVPSTDQGGIAGTEDQGAWMIKTWADSCRAETKIEVEELYNLSTQQDGFPKHVPDDVITDLQDIIKWYARRQEL